MQLQLCKIETPIKTVMVFDSAICKTVNLDTPIKKLVILKTKIEVKRS